MFPRSATRPPTPDLDFAAIPSPFAAPTINVPSKTQAYRDCSLITNPLSRLIRICQHFDKSGLGVLPLPGGLCVKYGRETKLSEAVALRFVAKNTKVPVPKVFCAFKKGPISYIVMGRIKGKEIGKGWAERPQKEQDDYLLQLKGYFEELRKIPHRRPGAIAAADMKPLWDPSLFKGKHGFGPFANEKDFNKFLRFGLGSDNRILQPNTWIEPNERAELCKMVELQDSLDHKVVFTHGDANSSNIFVKDGKVVGIIDFEFCGILP